MVQNSVISNGIERLKWLLSKYIETAEVTKGTMIRLLNVTELKTQ